MKIRFDYVPVMLVSVLMFQLTVLPDTLNIQPLARLVNTLILFVLAVGFCLLISKKRPTAVILYYSLPLILIILGYSINFMLALSSDTLGQAGKLLPYLGALTIPFLKKHDLAKCWNIFYVFMFWTVVIGIFEYAAIFGGVLEPVRIETSRGVFFKGIFSILHYLDGGIPYYRFYGVFPEPGTLAMFLTPALVYALIYSKKLAIGLFLIAIAMSASLGGYVSVLVVVYLFISWKAGKLKYMKSGKVVVFILAALCLLMVSEELTGIYKAKQLSASVREEQVSYFIDDFVAIVTDKPFGFILEGESLTALKSENQNYLGNNFSFYTAFVQGGILAFVGYTVFFSLNVIVLIKYYTQNHDPDRLTACAMLSLPAVLLYAFQRVTILESLLFAFLFSVPLLRVLTRK